MFVCVWVGGDMSPMETPPYLLDVVPRVVVSGALVWADVRGLPVISTVTRIDRQLNRANLTTTRLAVAQTPIAAEVAAQYAPLRLTHIPAGDDRRFLAPFPIQVLQPSPSLVRILNDLGIQQCGDLAQLSREAIEVRLGASGTALWHLARAHDSRRIFAPIPRSLPESVVEWTDYAISEAERLVFVLNRMCLHVCNALQSLGIGAVVMTLHLTLANRVVETYVVRTTRATASHAVWMRRLRRLLDDLTLTDAVAGIALRVETASALGGVQGDMFDRGFATARAADTTIEQLLDDQGPILMEAETTDHPLIERRTLWRAATPSPSRNTSPPGPIAPVLRLQLLPEPRPIRVRTHARRDHLVPTQYRDAEGTQVLLDVAGPDRVSGASWDAPYAREYFRCVTQEGRLVWLYYDLRTSTWFLHGWWD